MKQLTPLFTLACLVLFMTGCGDATTDEALPDGQAPNPPKQADAGDREAGDQDADDEGPEGEEADDGNEGGDEPVEPGGDRLTIPGMSYVVPEGWTDDPSKRSGMRDLTLVAPGGHELAVKLWPRIGSFQGNVQRWTQMQLGMTADQVVTAREGFEDINVGGIDATWMPLSNPTNNKAILAVWVPVPDNPAGPESTWTFKLTCPADQLDGLAPAVRAWAESVRFEDR